MSTHQLKTTVHFSVDQLHVQTTSCTHCTCAVSLESFLVARGVVRVIAVRGTFPIDRIFNVVDDLHAGSDYGGTVGGGRLATDTVGWEMRGYSYLKL